MIILIVFYFELKQILSLLDTNEYLVYGPVHRYIDMCDILLVLHGELMNILTMANTF